MTATNKEPPETESRLRKKILVMLSPEAIEYLDEKAPLFARGARGGRSAALESMINFVAGYEAIEARKQESE